MKVRVPKAHRPPALEFDWIDTDYHVRPGRFSCKSYRNPKADELYWNPSEGAVFQCFFGFSGVYRRVILERVK